MDKASNPKKSSHAVRSATPIIGDGNVATDVSNSARSTMPNDFKNSTSKYTKSFGDGLTSPDYDTQTIMNNQTVPSRESFDGTAQSDASSQVIVVRYTPGVPNVNQASNSDRRRVAAGRTLIVCVEGFPSWDEVVTLIYNNIDCSGVTLLPVDMATTQLNSVVDNADESVQITATTASPGPVLQPGVTRPNNLTPREKEIVQLYRSGVSTKKIAEVLRISNETLRTHRKNILFKVGCHSIVQAVAKVSVSNAKTLSTD